MRLAFLFSSACLSQHAVVVANREGGKGGNARKHAPGAYKCHPWLHRPTLPL